MESGKISESIKEGSLESKLGEAQNPYDETLEMSTEPVLCDGSNEVDFGKELEGGSNYGSSEGFVIAEHRLVGENVAGSEMDKGSLECCAEEGNVELARESNCGSLEAFVNAKNPLMGGNVAGSEINKGSLECCAGEGNVVMSKVDEVNNGAEKVMSEVDEVKGKNAEQYFPDKVESSRDGITLFVEVFGPLNGIEKSDDARVLEGRNSEQEIALEGNCTLFSDNYEKSSGEGSGEAKLGSEVEIAVVLDLQCPFNIGDLVWAKTKTQLWWPGIISNPSNASKLTAKPDKGQDILVKYIDNGNSIWCSQYQLKPFVENLEHMSKQNNSRSFLGAIEKAIGEISRRIKMEMTCSCFSKGSLQGASGTFSAAQFEPATFLSTIRYLALCISMPDKLNFAIIQNCLSAYYHSIGHLQLPMYRLRPAKEVIPRAQDGQESGQETKLSKGNSNDFKKFDIASTEGRDFSGDGEIPSAENGLRSTIMTSGNGYGSRERKKSKYLSYPYINVDQGNTKTPALSENETEEPKDGSSLVVETDSTSTPLTMSRGKTKKKVSRKHITAESTHRKVDVTNVSSTKMLVDLHLTALNCHFPMKSECSDCFRIFVLSFRKFAFLNEKLDNQKESSHEILNGDLPEESSFEQWRKNDVGSEGDNPHRSSTVNPKRRERKKKEKICPSGPATVNLPALVNDSQEVKHDAAKTPKVPKKRKNKADATPAAAGLQDLKGNNTTLSVEDMQITGPAASQGKLEPKKRKKKNTVASGCLTDDHGVVMPGVIGNSVEVIPMLKDLQGNIPGNNSESISEAAKPMASQSNVTEHIVFQHNDVSSPSAKPERKKRKRKEKTQNPPNISGVSGIPDLNGNLADSITTAKDLPGKSSVAPGVKPKQTRRRKKKTDAGITPVNSNYSAKIENHVEALGAILLLNFVPGTALPSKESLVSTFSVFGALKESETQGLTDSSAQIVFVKSSDAGFAYRSLEKNNPFGPALASFRINYLSQINNLQTAQSFRSTDGQLAPKGLSPLKPHNGGDPPDLHIMKRNLDMMTSMLEKAGNNLSPETKAKLESEIKGFKTKISSLAGPSSS